MRVPIATDWRASSPLAAEDRTGASLSRRVASRGARPSRFAIALSDQHRGLPFTPGIRASLLIVSQIGKTARCSAVCGEDIRGNFT
jgi:hypothetical protein